MESKRCAADTEVKFKVGMERMQETCQRRRRSIVVLLWENEEFWGPGARKRKRKVIVFSRLQILID